MSKPIDMRVTRAQQRGISLIELMVGITIGMLVVLAATGTIVLNRVAGNTVSDTATVTSQASNTMRQLVFALRQAGAFELQATQPSATASEQAFNLADPNSPLPAIISGINGSSTAPDEVTVNFTNRAAAVTRDCLGNQTANVNDNIPNRFYVNAANLMCQGLAGNPAQSMAQNIEDLQVLYLTESGAGWQWLNATQVAAAASWNRVVAAQICLQVRGDINHGSALVGNYTNCANAQTAHDRFYRLVVRQTVQLRNRMNNI